MSHQISYKITKLWLHPEQVNGFNSVVGNAFFKVEARDNATNVVGKYENVVNLPEPEENSPFIAYNELTESKIIEWLKSRFSESALSIMEEQAIADMHKNIADQTLPWSN